MPYLCVLEKNTTMKKFFLLGLLGILTLLACDDQRPQSEIDDEKIRDYLKANNLTAEKDLSGIYYIIERPGSGNNPNISSYIKVKYKGYLLDGTVFDQTEGDETVQFSLSGNITGWQIAVPLLKPGGKGTFFIPSIWGYGRFGTGIIPGNSVLIFEIELISFR